jgi:hypothetical protein
MGENGIISRINTDWLDPPMLDFSIHDPSSLGYKSLAFPFCLVVAGIIFAGIILIIEKIWCKPCLKRNV